MRARARQAAIARERLDVLVFAEIGMDPHTYALAHARLAPVRARPPLPLPLPLPQSAARPRASTPSAGRAAPRNGPHSPRVRGEGRGVSD